MHVMLLQYKSLLAAKDPFTAVVSDFKTIRNSEFVQDSTYAALRIIELRNIYLSCITLSKQSKLNRFHTLKCTKRQLKILVVVNKILNEYYYLVIWGIIILGH